MPTVTAPRNSAASRGVTVVDADHGTSRAPQLEQPRLAAYQASVAPWKSKWDSVRFVKMVAANWIA